MEKRDFNKILQRFVEIEIPETFDIVVAIARGGIIPASIINQRLQADFQIVKINLKDENQQSRYNSPQLLEPINFDFASKRILLVDDRIKSGATIKFAKELLQEAAVVKTFAVNGNADYALYNENCFIFPWNL